jgi:L-malate glycosyltransferase
MKIALVYDMVYPYSIGGVEFRNFQLANYLADKGHEVHIFCVKLWQGNNVIKDKLKKRNITIHGICNYNEKYTFKGKRSIFEPLKFSFVLHKELRKYTFDLIDCSSFPYFPALACVKYSKETNTPLIITWHEVWLDYWNEYLGLKGYFGRLIEFLLAKKSKNNITVSELTREKLESLGQHNIKLIENWINFNEIKKVKPSKEKSDLIVIGRQLKHKNIDLIMRSLKIVKEKHPNIRLFIVGNGPDHEALVSLSKKLNLEGNIIFYDFFKEHEKVISLMKSSKILVSASELEGFGISALEAMACKLPIVTLRSDRNAMTELVKDGNGLVLIKDKNEFAKAIIDLLDNEELVLEMSQKALESSKKYDMRSKLKELTDYYAGLVNR